MNVKLLDIMFEFPKDKRLSIRIEYVLAFNHFQLHPSGQFSGTADIVDAVIFMIFFFEFPSAVKRICPRVPTSRPFQRSADSRFGKSSGK